MPLAATLREKALKLLSDHIPNSSNGSNDSVEDLLPLQRSIRSQLVEQFMLSNKQLIKQKQLSSKGSLPNIPFTIHPPAPYGPGGYTAELISRKINIRNKKNFRRDNRIFERDERRKRNEIEGKYYLNYRIVIEVKS